MQIVGVIPARLSSTRLHEKMLADLGGKPLIAVTAERASASRAFDRVIVATDHSRILEAVQKEGFEAILTDPALPSGTARVAAIAKGIDAEVFVNIQGDEPLIDGEGLRRVAKAFTDSSVEMATLWFPLDPRDENNPNAVKVISDERNNALYFSRSLIPFPRNRENFYPKKHIGVYGYRRTTLLRLVELPPCNTEQIESLEQLRALHHGIKIKMVEALTDSIGVDTQADLDRVRSILIKGVS